MKIFKYMVKSSVLGKDNEVKNFINNKSYDLKLFREIGGLSIEGNNNKVYFKNYHSKVKYPKGIEIRIKGNNNTVIIDTPNFVNSLISIMGDNNNFVLGKCVNYVEGASFYLEQGGDIYIEKNCEIGNRALYVVVNGGYNKRHKLFIGEGTHIAREAIIRTSDGECLVDIDTKCPISEPEDIIISKHCWITSRCTILKGTYLPEGTIVGANSLLNKKYVEKNTLLAGTPAVIKKRNVDWSVGAYNYVMEKYTGENASIPPSSLKAVELLEKI